MTKKKKSNKLLHIFLIPGYLIIIYLGFSLIKRYYLFSNDDIEKRITIAHIQKIDPGAKTSPSFEYTFSFNGEDYHSEQFVDNNLRNKGFHLLKKEYIGKKFLVKFIKRNPNYSELLIDNPIKDSTLISPSEGWDKIPFY